MPLPPDPEGMNDARAEWAAAAIVAFQAKIATPDSEALADLLCDLLHLCDRTDRLGNFDDQLDRARRMYADETLPTPEFLRLR